MTNDRKLAKSLGQELALRLSSMHEHNLEEPTAILEDYPEYRIARGVDMDMVQKKLVSIRTQIIYDVMEMKNFAEAEMAAKNQDAVNEILNDINRMTTLAKFVNALLIGTMKKQGITAPFERIEFFAGWKIGIKKSQSSNVLVNREPTLDRSLHLLGTMMDQVGNKLKEIEDPLYGTKFTSKKKKKLEPMN